MMGEVTGVSLEPPTFHTRSPPSGPPPPDPFCRAWDPPNPHSSLQLLAFLLLNPGHQKEALAAAPSSAELSPHFRGVRVPFLEPATARLLDAPELPFLALKVMACHESLIGSATYHPALMIYTLFLWGHQSSGSRRRNLSTKGQVQTSPQDQSLWRPSWVPPSAHSLAEKGLRTWALAADIHMERVATRLALLPGLPRWPRPPACPLCTQSSALHRATARKEGQGSLWSRTPETCLTPD